MRGRRPHPQSVKSQKAPVRSQRKKKDSSSESGVAISTTGAPPAWLKDKEALAIWKRLAPILRLAKLLSDADTETFGRYCRNFARWLKMQKDIDKHGEHYESESQWGKLRRVNPSFLISDRLERQLLAAEDRFGLNPAERQRIFAARAATGVSPDLFTPAKDGEKRPGDPAAQATPAAQPAENPVGLLN